MTDTWDAIVVGGGPAGSAAAGALAAAGRRVVLVERERFPRELGAASLVPGIWPALDALEATEPIRAASFVPKAGGTFVTGRERARWTVYFGEAEEPAGGLQVRRSEFDGILLEAAARRGADVRTGCLAAEPLFDADRVIGARVVGPAGGEERIAARWLVDASGGPDWLPSRLGLVDVHPALRNRVAWSYWTGSRHMPGRDAGNSFCVQHGDAWLWHVPLDRDGLAWVGVVAHESSSVSIAGPEAAERYRAAVAGSELGRELLADAHQIGEVRAHEAPAHCSTSLGGPGWVLAGDAACFVDPVLTPGVQVACEQGLLAASTLCTVLDEPELAEHALSHYERTCRQRYEGFLDLAMHMYGHARPAQAAPGAAAPPGAPPASEELRARMAFVSMISGLPGPQVAAQMLEYLSSRQQPPAAGPGASEQVLEFLFFNSRRRRLAEERARRIGDELRVDVTVRLAPGVSSGHLLFSPDAPAGGLRRLTAVENRFGDRFQATPELEALLAVLGQGGRPYAEVERGVCARTGADAEAQRPAFRRWLDLLADYAIVEWQAAG